MPLLWYKIEKEKEKVTHLNFQVGNQVGNFLY